MSAFELMDPKMDSRSKRGEVLTPQKAEEQGLLRITERELKEEELLALLDEFMMQIASWLKGHQMQQTVYTCLYMAKREFYEKNKCLVGYIEALHYIFYKYSEVLRTSATLREEDVNLPPFIQKVQTLEVAEIVANLSASISEFQSKSKSN